MALVLLVASPAAADGWGSTSDIGAYGLVSTALAVPAFDGDGHGVSQAALSIGTASAVGLLGKTLIDAERPDGSSLDSFPSNHTANAFAAATTLLIRQGGEWGYPSLVVATLVGVGRVGADRHHPVDVLAGAVLGALSGWVLTRGNDDDSSAAPNSNGWTIQFTIPLR